MAWFTVHLASQHVRHVACHQGQQESSAAKERGRVLERKDRSPLTLPLLGCTRLVLGVPAQPQSPSSPTPALCKWGRSDNSCCNLLVVSVHAHQPSLGRTTPIAARPKQRVWLEAAGKNTSPSRVLSPSEAPLPVVLPVIKRNLQPAAERCTVINTNSHKIPWKGCGSTAQQRYLWVQDPTDQSSPNSPEYFHYLPWDHKIKMIFYA